MNFEAIKAAVIAIQMLSATRIDGDGWSAYRVGTIIRIDIKAKVEA